MSDTERHAPAVDRLLDLKECAAYLGLSRTKTYELWQSGAIPTVHIGRNRKCRTSDLNSYIASLSRQEGAA